MGRSNPTPGGSNATSKPVGVSGMLQSNTPSSGTFTGTPDTSDNTVVKGEVQEMGTTIFVDNAETAQKDESTVVHIDPRWFHINDTQQTEQSIKDFLAKPMIVASGNLSTTDTLTFIGSYPMPYYVIGGASRVMYSEKLRGYFGIRMDMRFRMVVNANRFQQGRYILGWVPTGGMGPSPLDTKSDEFRKAHMATLVQRTTIPHTELDIATTTSCELLVPYASIHTFYPLNAMTLSGGSLNSTLGWLNYFPYSPLVTPSGSTVASFTIYASLENVTLFGAASPQSLVAEREIGHKSNGPISSVATAFSKGFNEIASIPLLSSYAKSAAWISDRIAKAAKIFGYAKPTAGDSIGKIMILNNPGHSHVDGDSDTRALSYFAKPATVMLDGMSGTEFDEMDFAYIARKFAWLATVTWTTSSSGQIYSYPVGAENYVSLGGAVHLLPVGLMSALFTQWRGSIKVRLKFVKTEFHSGRLMVCFFPIDEIASNTTSPEYVNRHIIDIREYNEFTFEIPYISRYAWMPINGKTGILSVRVVDQLVAPASVSSSISILVEVAGGDDIQWSVPGVNPSLEPGEFVPQSGLSDPNKIAVNIGNTQTMGDPIAPSAYAIGDQITSFRTLLKRFYPLLPDSRSNTNTTTRLNSPMFILNVDLIPIRSLAAATNTVECDTIGMIASCYTFWGGSIRIKDVVSPGLTANPNLAATSNTTVATFVPTITGADSLMWQNLSSGTGAVNWNTHQVLQNTWLNNALTVEVPQYTRGLKRCIPDAWFSYLTVPDPDKVSYRANLTQGRLQIGIPAGLGTVTPVADYDLHNLYRSLGDDGEFSLFISIPPMFTPSNSLRYQMY
jgi:hypothetical protein